MKIKYLLFVLPFFLMSCNQQSKAQFDNYVYLTEDSIPELQELELEKVELPKGLGEYFGLDIYHDSILLVQHTQPKPYVVSVYNLNTMKLIGEFLESTEEMYSSLNQRDNRYYVELTPRMSFGNPPREVFCFNLDSLVMMGQSYNPRKYTFSGAEFWSFDALTDTSFLFYNHHYMENCGNKANESMPELFTCGLDGHIDYQMPEGFSRISGNPTAHIVSDLNRGKVFIPYHNKPQFTLLNSNLDTLKIVYGPDPLIENEYERLEFDNQIRLVRYNYFSWNPLSTENYIIVPNDRICNVPRENMQEISNNRMTEIFKFDWDGNLQARYEANNLFGLSSYSESTNTLYLEYYDENQDLVLYKAKLK